MAFDDYDDDDEENDEKANLNKGFNEDSAVRTPPSEPRRGRGRTCQSLDAIPTDVRGRTLLILVGVVVEMQLIPGLICFGAPPPPH